MGRNSGGTYTNPIPPFVSGTTIKTTEMNPKFQDIYDALSDSLSRSGQGSMQVPLQLKDGSAAAPSLTFASDPGTGLYRPAPYTVRLVSQAATLQEWALTYVNINVPLVVTSPLANTTAVTGTGNGTTGFGGNFTGGVGGANLPGARGLSALGGAGSGTGAGGQGLVVVGGASSGVGGSVQGVAVEAQGGIIGTSAPLDAAGTVMPTRYFNAVGNLPTAGGVSYPVSGFRSNAAGFNNMGLNDFFRTTATITTGWQQVRTGLRLDVDGVTAAGGAFELGATGPSIAAGTAATSGTPFNAITAANGYFGFATTVVPPASTTPIKDMLTQKHMPKSWAQITTTGTGAGTGAGTRVHTVTDGINITSVTENALGQFTVTFAQPFASTPLAIAFHGAIQTNSGTLRRSAVPPTATTYSFFISQFDPVSGTYTTLTLSGGGNVIDVWFYGAQ